jgi:glycosyltransferase involved in cell wall biosynthesis
MIAPIRQVLYLSGSRFPTNKAYGYQIVKECESLATLGLDVTLVFPELAPRQARNMCVPRSPDLTEYYPVRKIIHSASVPVITFLNFLYSDTASAWALLRILFFALVSRNIVRKFRKDKRVIIWTQDFFVLLIQLLGGAGSNDVLVFECHGISRKSLTVFSWLVRRITKLIVTTSGLKREFLRIGLPSEKILVLPNAVSMEEFSIRPSRTACRKRFDIPEHLAVIGYIGLFQTYGMEKGIPTLIRSAAYLKDMLKSPFRILCVGGPKTCEDEYLRIADEANVPRDIIQIEDFRPRTEIPMWMKSCDVGVIPFPAKRHFLEFASPMKMFEYMAAGIPVVASDLPVIRDVIQDGMNGLLFAPEDPFALAVAISRVLNDRRCALSLRKNGLRTVRGNSWERRAKEAYAFMMKTDL